MDQLVKVDHVGNLAPHPARDRHHRPGFPDGILEREPLHPATRHALGVEEGLGDLEEVVVRERLQARIQALALRTCI
ncbi:hypothetical protein [Embleya sp. NBC_00896]|uniref:hypothetical protein n=1 Tax=Embleya sp. NBC_00896 TaxID=2975961 RepID=UPI00386CFDFD|nr:hypothetical protein OG928_00130 [Embleya sp. NBC_00896]